MHFTGLACTKFSDKTKNAKITKFSSSKSYNQNVLILVSTRFSGTMTMQARATHKLITKAAGML